MMQIGRYHIIVDLIEIDSALLCDVAALAGFLSQLPAVIGMKILKGPEVVVGTSQNPGLTGFVIVDFSHIAVHTFMHSKKAYVDIFSCKPYEQSKAFDHIVQFFHADKSQTEIKVVAWK